jgi:hypothetical protein
MDKFIAQSQLTIPGTIQGFGNLGSPGGSPASTFARVIQGLVGLLTIAAFIWFIIQLFLGAIGFITAGGDKGKLAEARGRITTGLIGLVIAIAAIFIVDLIAYLLGIPSLLDLEGLINLIQI